MARPIMRRLSPLVLALLFVLLFVLWAPPPSPNAQESPAVRLTLLSRRRTARPHGGPALRAGGLELPPGARARPAFPGREPGDRTPHRPRDRGHAVLAGPDEERVRGLAGVRPSIVIDASTLPREDAIEPGKTRDFEISLSLEQGIDPEQSGVYPVKLDLRSGSPRSPSCERRPSSSSESPRSRSACHGRSCPLTRSCSRRTAPSPILPSRSRSARAAG